MYKNFIKRIVDFVVALVGLGVVSPILFMVIILLMFVGQGSVFFVQQRPGKNNRISQLIKFKTMNDKRDANGELLPDAERLTQIGKFIRSVSLDELPQLFNVLKGDMSLVGPRPLLKKYIPLYSKKQARRHEVRPGITGWAQVNGRNVISWEEKFKLDVWYVDNVSFALDCKILWYTVINVVKRKDINASVNTTMQEFKGTSNYRPEGL